MHHPTLDKLTTKKLGDSTSMEISINPYFMLIIEAGQAIFPFAQRNGTSKNLFRSFRIMIDSGLNQQLQADHFL